MGEDGGTIVVERLGKRDELIGELEEDAAEVVRDLHEGGRAAKKEEGAMGPGLNRGGMDTPLGASFKKPRFTSFKEAEGFGAGAAAGEDETRGAIGLEAKKITAGAGMPDFVDDDAVFPQPGTVLRSFWPEAGELLFQKIQGELEHEMETVVRRR